MRRSGNEDDFLILDLSTGWNWTACDGKASESLTFVQGRHGALFAVADGDGGAVAGRLASYMAVELTRDRMLQLQAHEVYGSAPIRERLRLSIEEANLRINRKSETNPALEGMSSTFTAVALRGYHAYFAQVGDSRAYLIRGDHSYRVTKDQSLVWQLVDAGQVTEEEAGYHSYRNVLLGSLGAHSQVDIEINTLPLSDRDTMVICSDGLWEMLRANEMAQIVQESKDLKSACRRLVDLANERGGEDNITVVIVRISGGRSSSPNNVTVEPRKRGGGV
jgi:protein phosphatase